MNKLRTYLSFSLVGLLLSGVAQAQAPTSPIDTDRANALLKQMTTEEKIGQLNQPFYITVPIAGLKKDPVPYEERVRHGQVGSFLFLTDFKEINRLQKIAMTEQRLHIPILFAFDVIHGFDTEFPVPLAMAASWDPALAEQAQAIAAEEAAHAGVHWSFAPMLDIARDPRWGRISEGAGEDPYLGAAMARAQVLGFQGRQKIRGLSWPHLNISPAMVPRKVAGTTTRCTFQKSRCRTSISRPFARELKPARPPS